MTNHPIEPHPVLEKVARAIAEARALPGTSPAKPAPWSSDVDKRAAHAALSALLNLTPDVRAAMIHHALHDSVDSENGGWNGYMQRLVGTMINTIIGDPQT